MLRVRDTGNGKQMHKTVSLENMFKKIYEKRKKKQLIFFMAFYIRFIRLTFSFYIFHEIDFKIYLKTPVTCMDGKIRHDPQTQHDTT